MNLCPCHSDPCLRRGQNDTGNAVIFDLYSLNLPIRVIRGRNWPGTIRLSTLFMSNVAATVLLVPLVMIKAGGIMTLIFMGIAVTIIRFF